MAANPAMIVRIVTELEEFKRNLAEGRNQIETTTAAMQKMATSFSGDKLIQHAHNVAAAVNQIGGASKLTEAEQARVNATVTKALEKYAALGKEAPTALRQLAEATKHVEEPTGGLTARMVALGAAIGTFIGQAAFDLLRRLGSGIAEIASQGLQLPATSRAFHDLAASVGQSGDEMLRVAQTATKGLIGDLGLMQAANKGLLLGLPITSASFGTLSQTAVVLGKAMGQGPVKSLDDFLTALGRSSPMILDNLGLSVKVGDANETYAKKLGKTAEQLTDGEKKLAFYNAAMAAAEAKVKTLGGVQLTLTDHIQRLKVAFTDQLSSLVATTSQSQTLTNAFARLVDIGIGVANAGATLVRAWQGAPELLRSLTSNTVLAAGGIWAIHAAAVALGSSGLLPWLGRALVAAYETGFGLTLLSGGFAAARAATVTFATQIVTLGGTLTGLNTVLAMSVGALGPIAVAVAAVTATVMIGYQAWQLYKESKERAIFDAANQATDQRMLAEATRVAGRAVTDYSEGLRILKDNAAKLRGEQAGVTEETKLATLATDLHKFATVQLSSGVQDYIKRAVAAGQSNEQIAKTLADANLAGDAAKPIIARLSEAHKEAEQKTKAHRAAVEEIRLAQIPLTQAQQIQIGQLQALGLGQAEITKALGVGAAAVKRYTDDTNTLSAAWKMLRARTAEVAQTIREDFQQSMQAGLASSNAVLAAGVTRFVEVQDELHVATKTGVDRQLAELAIKERKELGGLEDLRRLFPQVYTELAAVVKLRYAQMAADAAGAISTMTQAQVGSQVRTRTELSDTAFLLRDKYEQMLATGLYTTGELQRAWREWADAAGEAGERTRATWSEAWRGIKEGLTKVLEGVPQTLANAFTGGGDIMGAVKSIGSSIGSIAGQGIAKAMSFAGPMGQAIGSAIGSLAGPLIGMIAGLFSKPEYKEIMKGAGREFGIDISEGLAKKIAEDSTRLGDRMAAMLFHVADMVKEAGGVVAYGLDKTIAKARDLFVMIETGKLTVEDAGKAFNDVFALLAPEAIDKTTGLAKASFLELIDLSKRFGVESKAVMDFQIEQAGAVTAGWNAVANAMSGPLLAAVKDQQDQQIDLAGTTAANQDAFDRMGRLAVVAFDAALASGQPFAAALAALGPGLDGLSEAQRIFGFESSATFDELLKFRQIAQDNQELFASLDGVNQMMRGLHNLGMLTEGALSDLQATAIETFDQLVLQGVEGDSALRLMQPTLQTIWALQQDFGYAVDEGTQALLDQAVASGVVGDAQRDVQERIARGIERIADLFERTFGDTFPDAVERGASRAARSIEFVGNAAWSAATDVADASAAMAVSWSHVQEAAEAAAGNSPTGVELITHRVRELRDEMVVVTPDVIGDMDEWRRQAEETSSTRGRFLDFGSGTPAVLHGRERVVTERESIRESSLSTAALEAEFQALRRELRRDFPRAVGIAVQDAIVLAR